MQTSGYREKAKKMVKSSSPANISSGLTSNHDDMDFNTLMVMKKTNSVVPRVSVDVLGHKKEIKIDPHTGFIDLKLHGPPKKIADKMMDPWHIKNLTPYEFSAIMG